MFGDKNSTSIEKGIIHKAIEYLITKAPVMTVSFVEYHMGKWRDLAAHFVSLDDKYANNYEQEEIKSVQDIEMFLERVLCKRTTKSTDQNDSSSRSHAVFTVSIGIGGPKMLFVDMAGNEKSKGKENINETCFINKSLTQLNTVLAYKAKQLPNPPYRDNNFTLFLQPYMAKNKVIIFYHVRKENFSNGLMPIQDCCIRKKNNTK